MLIFIGVTIEFLILYSYVKSFTFFLFFSSIVKPQQLD